MKFPLSLLKIAVVFAISLLLSLPAAIAQITESQTSADDAIDRFKSDIARAERQIDTAADSDAELVALKLTLDELGRNILKSAVAFRPRLAEIGARLEEIGATPGKDEPADSALVEERRKLSAEKAQINAILGEQETLLLQASKLSQSITQLRRDLFSARLFQRVPVTEAMSVSLFSDFANETRTLWRKIGSWARFSIRFKLHSVLWATLLAIMAAYLMVFFSRRFFGLGKHAQIDIGKSGLHRIIVAFWSTVMPSAAVATFLVATYFFFDQFEVLTGAAPQMIGALFNVIFVFFFVNRLANSILRPKQPQLRLVKIRDKAARLLSIIVTALAVVVGIDFLMETGGEIVSSSFSLTVAKSAVGSFLVGALILGAAFVRPFEDENGQKQRWPKIIMVLLVLLGLVPIIAVLSGYFGLARFVSQQVVVNGAFLITMYVGFLTGSAVGAVGAFASTSIGRWLKKRFSLSEETLDQAGMLTGMAINASVLLVGIPLILLQYGFKTGDLQSWLYGVMSEIKVGSISISLIGVLTGIFVFIAGLFLTRWFQRWLDGSVMARGKVDSGVRHSIRTAVGYAGIGLAVLFGVSTAGINLSNLALVAGALSLGIGFGLQNIVSNFVSGLILLAERPFKVGDWIEAGAVSGTVKRINVRATEIETFQRQTVIMPNSELINAAVGNWTHRNKLARGDIKIGVAYGTDPKMVRSILLEIARAHPLVLKNPEPFVIFANFGESSLDFELRFFLADVGQRQEVATEIRFSIVEAFEGRGIEIPFPQRDLNITQDSIRALAKALSDGGGEASSPAGPLSAPKPAKVRKSKPKPKSARSRSTYRELD